jgi:hypothetical protein
MSKTREAYRKTLLALSANPAVTNSRSALLSSIGDEELLNIASDLLRTVDRKVCEVVVESLLDWIAGERIGGQ